MMIPRAGRILGVLVGVALVVGTVGCSKPADDRASGTEGVNKEEQAIAAARVWLETVDDGGYARSWDTSANLFQRAVGKGQWSEQLTAIRTPLGGLVSRELASSHYATELPGAPDGEYVVIQFTTSFENKRTAVETITPMLEENGAWKVSGYFIK